jgi:chemotaxis signal transduction protein
VKRTYTEDEQWIVVRLQEQLFAVPSATVMEMLAMPEMRSVPRVPPHIRGVMNLRGRVMPLVDLRLRLCLDSSARDGETLIEAICAREEDHRAWASELEASVRERREFQLVTDPHKCAFGNWRDSYKTSNIALAAVLKKFEDPHAALHSAGADVVHHAAHHRWEEATRLAERVRDVDLPLLIKLFADLRTAIQDSHRETAVVLEGGGTVYAVSVDAVESVEQLKPGTIEPVPAAAASSDGLVSAVARRLKNDGIVMLLDTDRVLDEQGFQEALQAASQAA